MDCKDIARRAVPIKASGYASMNFSQKTKPFQGVFSTTRKSVIGTGTTKRRVSQTVCFFVEQDEKGHIVMRPLNQNMVPVGTAVSISKDELLADYTPEPSVYLHKVHPQMRKMEDHAQRGEKLREEGALYTCLLYTSPSPRDRQKSRMPSSA
eukprot:TRINITY_DN1670_c0_g1_i1.p1 TRINITY_DN1670_c0_g1~~TRINITY_DN1670_c0_g1_i1.p1  ORF type:complete len:152 (+),score=25.89 TRINITY_DN1670_c0_g1_i1:490-945(+)